MKYVLLAILVLSGCSQNKVKIEHLAERFCRCEGNGSAVQRIAYFGSLKALVACTKPYSVNLGDDDFIADCTTRTGVENE